MRLTKNFSSEEFACKGKNCCGGESRVTTVFIEMLQEARDIACIPFYINSGYRCPIHNKDVGSKPSSAHIKGCAADVRADNDRDRYVIHDGLRKAGFTRFGLHGDYIHVDSDFSKPQRSTRLY